MRPSVALGFVNRFVPVAVLWAIPAVLVLEYVNHQDRFGTVGIQWTTTLEVVNGVYMVLAPLAAGVAALAYSSVARHREMVDALPDGGLRAYATPTLTTALVLFSVHAGFLAVVIVIDAVRGVPGLPDLLPTGVILAVLVAASGVGAVVARFAQGSRLAAPVSMLLVYGYEIFEHTWATRLLSDFGGASESLLGQRQRLDILALQALWLGALSALLVGVSIWGWRAAPRVAVGLALWVTVGASAYWVGQLGDNRFEESDVTWLCSSGETKVCVAREYRDELGYFTPRVSGYAAALSDLGLTDVPSEFRQISGQSWSGGRFGIDHQAEPLAYKVMESSLGCSDAELDNWTNRIIRQSDQVVAYLIQGEGGRLTPGQKPATRQAAVQALAELAC